MDGLDAIQIVNFYIINTHTLFPVAFKKMQSLAIAVEVIVFSSLMTTTTWSASMQNICYGYNSYVRNRPTFVRLWRQLWLASVFYIILYQYQRIYRDQFLCFSKRGRMVIRCFTGYFVVLVCNEMVYSPGISYEYTTCCSYASTVPLSPNSHSHVSIP